MEANTDFCFTDCVELGCYEHYKNKSKLWNDLKFGLQYEMHLPVPEHVDFVKKKTKKKTECRHTILWQ